MHKLRWWLLIMGDPGKTRHPGKTGQWRHDVLFVSPWQHTCLRAKLAVWFGNDGDLSIFTCFLRIFVILRNVITLQVILIETRVNVYNTQIASYFKLTYVFYDGVLRNIWFMKFLCKVRLRVKRDRAKRDMSRFARTITRSKQIRSFEQCVKLGHTGPITTSTRI